jgi:hypothetical protein
VKNSAPSFWYKGYSVKLCIAPGKVSSFEIIPHFYDEENSCLKLMTDTQKDEFTATLCRLNQILKDDRLCDRYYAAAARKYLAMYEPRMSDHFYNYCVLGTEEHVDVFQCAGRERAAGEIPAAPEDLGDFLK